MSDLQISGFTEHSGDWTLASNLKSHAVSVIEVECEQNSDAVAATIEEIIDAESLYVYSFGYSTLADETGGYRKIPPGKEYANIFVVAGVSDWAMGQFSLAKPPTCAKRVYNFVASNALPSSQFLMGFPTYDINDPDLIAKLTANEEGNIDCTALFPVQFWDIPGRIKVHTTIQNHPKIQSVIIALRTQAV